MRIVSLSFLAIMVATKMVSAQLGPHRGRTRTRAPGLRALVIKKASRGSRPRQVAQCPAQLGPHQLNGGRKRRDWERRLSPNLEHQPEPLCYREARIQVQIYIVALPPSCLATMMATKMVAAARGTGKPSTHGLSAQERGCRDGCQCLGIDLCIQKDFTLDES